MSLSGYDCRTKAGSPVGAAPTVIVFGLNLRTFASRVADSSGLSLKLKVKSGVTTSSPANFLMPRSASFFEMSVTLKSPKVGSLPATNSFPLSAPDLSAVPSTKTFVSNL